MGNWWMVGKSRRKLEAIVNLKNQTRVLPDGSRISGLLETDKLVPYLYDDACTIWESVRRGLRVSNNGPMLGARIKQSDDSEPYIWISYQEVIDRSEALAYGLLDLGMVDKPKNYIGVFAKNRPEWIMTELAVYSVGGVLVPLYETLGTDAFTFIINQAEIELIVCDTEKKALAILSRKGSCPLLKYIVVMDELSVEIGMMATREGVRIYSFFVLQERGLRLTAKPHLKVPEPEDLCTICYTSGTTGTPKGVMLTHANVVACTTAAKYIKNVAFTHNDVMMSFLPLAHMFERILECAAFQVGASVGYFRGDVRGLPQDLKELRPTVIPLVPRVLNRVYDKVMSELGKSFVKKCLFDIAVAFKKREVQSGIVRSNSIFDKVVFKKIREGLGGRVRIMITGSAPLAENVMKFARAAMGCIVLEGYGQTECVAASTVGVEADATTGHVGIPTICNLVKLVDVPELGYFAAEQSGEVCIKGYNVFKGYFKNETLTKEVLDEDGWLHTGDIGRWTSTGTLKIIDRKKHIFKLAQGEYVAPEKIENVYSRSKFVAQSFIHGESLRTCLIGIVVPDVEVLGRAVAERFGIKDASLAEMCEMEDVKKMIFEDMVTTGKKAGLFSFEQVKDIHLFPELFSVENGLLTPTLKSKRPSLKTYFASQIEQMYSALS